MNCLGPGSGSRKRRLSLPLSSLPETAGGVLQLFFHPNNQSIVLHLGEADLRWMLAQDEVDFASVNSLLVIVEMVEGHLTE